jgi:LemA protein
LGDGRRRTMQKPIETWKRMSPAARWGLGLFYWICAIYYWMFYGMYLIIVYYPFIWPLKQVIRNRLVSRDENVNRAWADVEVVLQRRLDLVDNIVGVVRGFAQQERQVLESVVEARARLGSVIQAQGSLEEKVEAAFTLQSALGRLLVVVERYPELRSSEHFKELQHELARTEGEIAQARAKYNHQAAQYNKTVRQFPWSAVASGEGFVSRPYFSAGGEASRAPKVDFAA